MFGAVSSMIFTNVAVFNQSKFNIQNKRLKKAESKIEHRIATRIEQHKSYRIEISIFVSG